MTHPCLQLSERLHIGTSGWSYPHWKDSFYTDIPKHAWLPYYASHFSTIEINASFYRTQTSSTLQKWLDSTPPGFDFTIKANRFITHNKKLRDCEQAIIHEKDSYHYLGKRLAAVLWQLPPGLSADRDRLTVFVQALRHWNCPHVIEFRHASWFCEEVATILAAHRITACISDSADWPLWECLTSDLVYIRLHGHSSTYQSYYSSRTLKQWMTKIRTWMAKGYQVRVYFDNDAEGHAPRDALRLCQLASESVGNL